MKARLTVLSVAGLTMLFSAALWLAPHSMATGGLTGVKICIDPGHGGSDPGAVNTAYGLHESEINLDVSYALKALLEGEGAAVVMTRTDDSDRSNRDRYTFCNGEQATILVSVHTNSVDDTAMDGSMALYFHEDDRALAQAVYDVMYPTLRASAPDPDNFTGFGLNHFASGVLLKSDMPAAMMEPLFMSNPAEASLLVQRIYDNLGSGTVSAGCADLGCRRGQITRAIHQGVLSYFGGTEPTPTPEPTPDPGGTMQVSAMDMSYERKGPNYFISTRVTIGDADGAPVAGATVSLTTSGPDGATFASSGVTGDDGMATFQLKSTSTGLYESTVVDVSKEGWLYDASASPPPTMTLEVP